MPEIRQRLPSFFIPLLWLGLAASLYAGARAGHLLVVHAAYSLAAEDAEAAVTEVYIYSRVIRKPRPSRYVNQYKGAYALSVNGKSCNGAFDTASFIGAEETPVHAGDRLQLRCLKFGSGWCRPKASLGSEWLLAAAVILCFSLFAAAAAALLLLLAARARNFYTMPV
ncbi:MAG: hypothetical protein A2016_03805 [Elusimicrobia bacterium GWF2_62_30]|nr:MAG: hypothetical protein A2016_03805 [Elusimicrobia bacterium GWF2_62_30]